MTVGATIGGEAVPIAEVTAGLVPDADLATLRPCPLPQRHRSWSVERRSGTRCWVKIGSDDVAVAGVRREAEILEHLDGRWSTPQLLASDPTIPATATAHIDGRSLADQADGDVGQLLPSLAEWLRGFASSAGIGPHRPSTVAEWDLFGEHPDVVRLLGPGAGFWESTAERLGVRPPEWPDPPRRPTGGSVHGSFDEDNILFDRSGAIAGVLDLEAARVGPIAIDAAGMAADLLLRRGAPTARSWLALWPADQHDVEAFLLLRLWHRHQHEALPDDVLVDALSLRSAPGRSGGRPRGRALATRPQTSCETPDQVTGGGHGKKGGSQR